MSARFGLAFSWFLAVLTIGQACKKEKVVAGCYGTAPTCRAGPDDCLKRGFEVGNLVDKCDGGSSCWTGKKIECMKEVTCNSCPVGKYLSDGDCETCASCSYGKVRFGCGGSSPGECMEANCFDADVRFCPSGGASACIFEQEEVTIRTSSKSKTTTTDWKVSSHSVIVPTRVQNYADVQLEIGTEYGQSTSVTNTKTFTDQETQKTYIALRPGFAYCYYKDVKIASDGPPTCYAPKYFEVELSSSGGVGIDLCGSEFQDKPMCPPGAGCEAVPFDEEGETELSAALTMTVGKLLTCCCLTALLSLLV